MDIIIKEYSKSDTTEGEAIMYAENIQTKAIHAAKPKNNKNFQVYSSSVNHSLNIN